LLEAVVDDPGVTSRARPSPELGTGVNSGSFEVSLVVVLLVGLPPFVGTTSNNPPPEPRLSVRVVDFVTRRGRLDPVCPATGSTIKRPKLVNTKFRNNLDFIMVFFRQKWEKRELYQSPALCAWYAMHRRSRGFATKFCRPVNIAKSRRSLSNGELTVRI